MRFILLIALIAGACTSESVDEASSSPQGDAQAPLDAPIATEDAAAPELDATAPDAPHTADAALDATTPDAAPEERDAVSTVDAAVPDAPSVHDAAACELPVAFQWCECDLQVAQCDGAFYMFAVYTGAGDPSWPNGVPASWSGWCPPLAADPQYAECPTKLIAERDHYCHC